ncbi:hypothetical protein HDU87_008046 [Geranomyces variabilis]|uniref:ABC transporter domain-containing protein n=1 Tax=Geranomyces variabilis TaxID=109894 RepID=A0AAD5XQ51_9FUNG|nr:hypothetical protein HDU87_008046 [Geranomyces variabilis]
MAVKEREIKAPGQDVLSDQFEKTLMEIRVRRDDANRQREQRQPPATESINPFSEYEYDDPLRQFKDPSRRRQSHSDPNFQPSRNAAQPPEHIGISHNRSYDYSFEQLERPPARPAEHLSPRSPGLRQHFGTEQDDNVAFYEQVAPAHNMARSVRMNHVPRPLVMSRAGSYPSLPEARSVGMGHVARESIINSADPYMRPYDNLGQPMSAPMQMANTNLEMVSQNSVHTSPGSSLNASPWSTPPSSRPGSPSQSRRPLLRPGFPREHSAPNVFSGKPKMHRVASEQPLIKNSFDSIVESEPLPPTNGVLPTAVVKKYPPAPHIPPPGPRKTYQARALGRKALSFQRRQWFTNVCCIALCPIMMVVVSALVGYFVSNVIKGQDKGYDILYCSDQPSFNQQNWPIFNLDADQGIANNTAGPSQSEQVPRVAPGRLVKHANFYSLLLLATAGGDLQSLTQLGLLSLFPSIPCISWFGEGYPTSTLTSDVYEHPTSLKTNAYATLDSAYTSEVRTGWLDIFRSDILADPKQLRQAISLGGQFAQYQIRPWAAVGYAANVSRTEVGAAPQQPPLLALTAIPATIPGAPPFANFKPGSTANGMLDTIEPRWYISVDVLSTSITGIQQVPYFEVYPPETTSADDLNTLMANQLQAALNNLTQVDQSAVYNSARTDADLAKFITSATAALEQLPYGTIFFDQVDHVNKKYKYTLAMGFDARLATSQIFPTAGRRQALQLSQLSNAILRRGNPAQFGSSAITQGTRIFPQVASGGLTLSISGSIGRVLYPFALSFLLPIFVLALVREKESRVLMMMRMNGLKASVYYISHFVTFFVLYMISALVFLAAGYAARLDMFVKTDFAVLIILLILWGAVQVALALFFSSFFDRAHSALLIVFFIVLCGIISSIAANQVFTRAPDWFFLWPPFAFYRCLGVINAASFVANLTPYKLGSLRAGDEVFTAMVFMAVETVVLVALAVYFSHVLPAEYGVRKPWHFPVTELLRKSRSSPSQSASMGSNSSSKTFLPSGVATNVPLDPREDDDVRAERARVAEGAYPPNCPLVIQALHKSFPARHGTPAKTAVKSVSLALVPGQVFGLLGPNGAGKTTLISVLTGLRPATSGTARVAGLDVRTRLSDVHTQIGVCPQFDLLWAELSVEDHLLFYARLKGIAARDEGATIARCLQDVRLGGFEKRLVAGLSGGEKRRLSIAIALVGDPRVVFLDEPTTGLDPEVRRLIWDVIEQARSNRTIILTTHSMEEAETCCHTLSIMARGTLTCIGPLLRLKQLYGSGYKMHITARSRSALERAAAHVEGEVLGRSAPWHREEIEGAAAASKGQRTARWVFMPRPGLINRVLRALPTVDGVVDWALEQRSLDDVFLNVLEGQDDALD